MKKLVIASECAEIISQRFNIPLFDLVDVFADIPGIHIDGKEAELDVLQ
jgi:hypothetical protein